MPAAAVAARAYTRYAVHRMCDVQAPIRYIYIRNITCPRCIPIYHYIFLLQYYNIVIIRVCVSNVFQAQNARPHAAAAHPPGNYKCLNPPHIKKKNTHTHTHTANTYRV